MVTHDVCLRHSKLQISEEERNTRISYKPNKSILLDLIENPKECYFIDVNRILFFS